MNIIKKTYKTTLALLALTSSIAFAQETDILKSYELPQFTELQVQMNTEVIILNSSRNYLVVQGDSLSQNSIKIETIDGKVLISSNKEANSSQPTRVLVETTSMASLTTGGLGKYFIIGQKDKALGIYNPTVTAFAEVKED
tara:strand:+ start:3084 stop:3506 length:423 start_codon:yes stop_codon:yes gene_type:complete